MILSASLVVTSILSLSVARGSTGTSPRVSITTLSPLQAQHFRRFLTTAPVSGTLPLHLTLFLKGRNSNLKSTLLSKGGHKGALPSHANLTPAQYRNLFGDSRAQIATVTGYLRAHGLTVDSISSDRLSITVSGPASKVAASLNVHLANFQQPAAQEHAATLDNPTLPASVGDLVQTITGLEPVGIPQPFLYLPNQRAVESASTASPATSPTYVYGPSPTCSFLSTYSGSSPNAYLQLYGLSSQIGAGQQGQGTTVALIEYTSTTTSDFSTFDSCLGISPSISVNDTTPSTPIGDSAALEVNLDAETVAALAPRSSIVVEEADNGDLLAPWIAAVDNPNVNVISSSWGVCEPLLPVSLASAENSLFQQATIEGKTIFASSGDSGASGCLTSNGSSSHATDDPASQPYVVGVGGTQESGSLSSPTYSVWSDYPGSQNASGGGYSSTWGRPTWQSAPGVSTVESSGCATSAQCRLTPDVSAIAGNPYFTTYCTASSCSGPWEFVGGTSFAAPAWAASLADAETGLTTKPGLLTPTFYALMREGDAPLAAVTSGNNSVTGDNLYPVSASSFNLATGLGTLSQAQHSLANLLNTSLLPSTGVNGWDIPSSLSVNAAISPIVVDVTGGTGSYTLSASGLPPGLSLSGNTISGTPDLIPSDSSIAMSIVGTPTTVGTYSATLTVAPTDLLISPSRCTFVITISTSSQGTTTTIPNTTTTTQPTTSPYPQGYVTATNGGVLSSFGSAPYFGSAFYGLSGQSSMVNPAVAVAWTPSGNGYWIATTVGTVYPFGGAVSYGSIAPSTPTEPIVDIVPTYDGDGYWLIGADGSVYSFGDASSFGSLRGLTLTAPIVGMQPTSDDQGYWLLGADGTVYTFGNATSYGEPPPPPSGTTYVALAATADAGGYWLLDSTGTVHAFGDAVNYGSAQTTAGAPPYVAMAPTADGQGYVLVDASGAVSAFGDAVDAGSPTLPGVGSSKVVSIAEIPRT